MNEIAETRTKCNNAYGLVLSALMVLTYTIFIVPGIDITVPTHGDIYGYSFLFDSIPFSSIYLTPRPIMGLALKLGGSLSFSLMMWAFAIVGTVSLVSPLVAYSKIVKKNIPISGWVLFALLIVSYPGTYLGLIHDIGSRLALIFAAVAVCYFVNFFRQNNYYFLFVAFIYTLLGFLSKETFGPFLFLLVIYIGYMCKAKIGPIVAGIFTVTLGLAIAMLHSRFLGSPFTSGKSSYAVDFNVLNITKSGIRYLSLAVSPQILLCLLAIGIFMALKREWKGLSFLIIGFLITWSSILPNAMLTQHGGSNYEMILVPLLSVLIVIHMDGLGLFHRYKKIIVSATVLLMISGIVWGRYSLNKNYWWEMGIARFNQNAIHSLGVHKNDVRSSNEVVVLGLQQDHIVQPWTPFTASQYLRDNFDFRTTTFKVVGPGIVGTNDAFRVYLPNLEKVNRGSVDLVMVFGADGNVWRIIRQREQIIKFLNMKGLDMTKLYDLRYWTTNIDPKLNE